MSNRALFIRVQDALANGLKEDAWFLVSIHHLLEQVLGEKCPPEKKYGRNTHGYDRYSRLFENGILRFLRIMASVFRPIVLIIDDAQSSHPATLGFFGGFDQIQNKRHLWSDPN